MLRAVSFSSPAEAWLDTHPDRSLIIYAWAFAAGDGRVEVGQVIRGYVPEVRYVELRTESTRTRLTYATYPRRIIVIELRDLGTNPPE